MKNERQANIALVAFAEESKFKGDLGEKRQPHARPSWLRRFIARWFS